MKTKRVILDYEDFENLIKGEVVEKDGIQIALSDIGFTNMINAILVESRKQRIEYSDIIEGNPGV